MEFTRGNRKLLSTGARTDYPLFLHLLVGHFYAVSDRYSAKRSEGTDDWLLVATMQGRGRFGDGRGRLITQPQQLVLISPGTPHDYGALPNDDPWDFYWAHFHPRSHWFDWLNWPSSQPGVMTLNVERSFLWASIAGRFSALLGAANSGGLLAEDLGMNFLDSILLTCQAMVDETENHRDSRILEFLAYIDRSLSSDLNVSSLASDVALSDSRFSHLFRDETGIPPLQYIDLRRMQRAKVLLERTSISITQIAEEVGMTQIGFSRRFKQQVGVTPREYRNGSRKR